MDVDVTIPAAAYELCPYDDAAAEVAYDVAYADVDAGAAA